MHFVLRSKDEKKWKNCEEKLNKQQKKKTIRYGKTQSNKLQPPYKQSKPTVYCYLYVTHPHA